MVERNNIFWQMGCRRMARLTNGDSKKWQHHEATLALMCCVYYFVTIHSTLKTTPAVEHGLTDHLWTMEALLGDFAQQTQRESHT